MKSLLSVLIIIILSAVAIILAENYIMRELLVLTGFMIGVIEVFLLNFAIKE